MRAKAFYKLVAPFFRELDRYTLIDCCAGDGKTGVEFDSEPNLERIIFVDIYEPNKFEKNTARLKTPFEASLEGIEGVEINSVYSPAALIALHSCGILTDHVLEKAVLSSSPVAVMPCCYNQRMRKYSLKNPPDNRKLLYPAEKDYYDAFRIQFLKEQGYKVFLRQIDERITPMNNAIIGVP